MAPPTTLFRFKIELSDIDRAIYTSLDFRVAQHPSEAIPYLLTRVLAFSLSYEDGLIFSPQGLSDPDAPGLISPDQFGGFKLWIEIGNPSARKLHKASKSAKLVRVYTYKKPESLIREIQSEKVHRSEEIEIYSFSTAFLNDLALILVKENSWNLIHDNGSLMISAGDKSAHGEVTTHSLREQGT